MTNDIQTFGFPPGYFVIRSVATGRLLDVTEDEIEDGTEVILWPEKETSLVESRRNPEANNQVFFIDTSGALCSRSAGHAVDIEGDRLVLRHRRPVSYPFPNAYAHPLPTFAYSAETGQISVNFNSDPTYPPPNSSGSPTSSSWKTKTYLLASVPLRKPRTIIDDAADFLTSAITTPFSFLSGSTPTPHATPEEVFSGVIDLHENEIIDEERGEEAEVDDSNELGRKVRMVSINHGQVSGEKAKNRRRWEISSLRRIDARTGAL